MNASPFNPLDPFRPRCEFRTLDKRSLNTVRAMLAQGWRVYRNGLFSVQLWRKIN